MTILEEIIRHKKEEILTRRELYPVKLLERSAYFKTPVASLKKYLRRSDKAGVIAEIKRRSPSKGELNRHISIEKLSIGYMQAGASALSILTDQKYFGGSNDDLVVARKLNFCPILRKDFIVDEYQLVEARSIGADAVLLIASVLGREECRRFARCAKDLGLEVILEVHNRQELDDCLSDDIDILGVNNRDLRDFSTNVQRSFELAAHIPQNLPKISESGLDSAETIRGLKRAGFDGFLIGEAFMRNSKPERACAKLIDELNRELAA